MTPDRLVSADVLLARGLTPQEVRHITGNQAAVQWHLLARMDGGLALAVLTNEEFEKIRQELGRAGMPAPQERTRQEVLLLVWTLAANHCPESTSPWYSRELHSSCACGVLLRLVAEAWGFDADTARQQELELFASRLGVATTVENLQ